MNAISLESLGFRRRKKVVLVWMNILEAHCVVGRGLGSAQVAPDLEVLRECDPSYLEP